MRWDELRIFLNDAIKLSNDIGIKYKQLKTMELCGSMLDQIYKNTCVELNNLLLEEEKMYASNEFDKKDFENLFALLHYNYNIDTKLSIEDLLHNQKFFDGNFRVFFIINDKFKKNQDAIVENLIRQGINADLNYNLKDQFKNNWCFIDSIYTNYYWVVISFINKYLETDTTIKEELVRVKYLILFLNSHIEKEFKHDNFEFQDKTYLNYHMFGDFIKMPRQIQKVNIQNILFSKFLREQFLLLDLNDKKNSGRKFDIILSEILMRSATIFLEDNFLNARKTEFDEFMKKNFIRYLNNQENIGRINRIYTNTKKDKQYYKYLSLKPY